jgi:hypothetical protein
MRNIVTGRIRKIVYLITELMNLLCFFSSLLTESCDVIGNSAFDITIGITLMGDVMVTARANKPVTSWFVKNGKTIYCIFVKAMDAIEDTRAGSV